MSAVSCWLLQVTYGDIDKKVCNIESANIHNMLLTADTEIHDPGVAVSDRGEGTLLQLESPPPPELGQNMH